MDSQSKFIHVQQEENFRSPCLDSDIEIVERLCPFYRQPTPVAETCFRENICKKRKLEVNCGETADSSLTNVQQSKRIRLAERSDAAEDCIIEKATCGSVNECSDLHSDRTYNKNSPHAIIQECHEGREQVDKPNVDRLCSTTEDLVVKQDGKQFFICAHTDIGGKSNNEDRFNFEAVLVNNEPALMAAVYDGHGGYQAAEFACQKLFAEVKRQIESIQTTCCIKTAIKAAFVNLHLEMMINELDKWPKAQDRFRSTAGTTVSFTMILGNKLYVANVGDSPVFLGYEHFPFGSCVASRLSVMHNLSNTSELKRITAIGAKTMEGYVLSDKLVDQNGVRTEIRIKLNVTRAMGDFWSKKFATKEFMVSPEPDVSEHSMDSAQVIFLATDGVTDVLSDQEVVQIWSDSKESKGAAKEIIRAAKNKWERRKQRADNLTTVVIGVVAENYFEET